MQSLVVLLVDHGETLDPLNQLVDETTDNAFNIPGLNVIDWTNRVDIPTGPRQDIEYTFRVMPTPRSVVAIPSRDAAHYGGMS